MRTRAAVLLTLAAMSGTFLVAAPARAEEHESKASGGLAVVVEPGAGGLPPGELRAAISREVGVPLTNAITLSTTRLLVEHHGGQKIRFELVQPDGRRVQRSVDLASVPAGSAVDTAALVAATLLEDEAASLVEALRARDTPPPVVPPPPPRLPPPCARRPEDVMQFVGADLAPYVGTSTFERPDTVRHLSLEGVGSHHAGVRGLQFSPLLSFGGDFVCGVQFAGLGAHTRGSVSGVAIAGLAAFHGGSVDGFAFAGLGNWIEGRVTGVAFVGLAARTEDVQGVTFAGVIDVSRRTEGLHVAGVIGWTDTLAGVQFSGISAFTARRMDGLQVAPLTFSSEVNGMQLGTMNIGGYVHGVQLGFVNVARTSDASIGALSFVSEGRTNLQAWASTGGTLSVAAQHGSRWVHNFYGGTIAFSGSGGVALGPLLGIGLRLPAAPFYVDVDHISQLLFDPQESGTPQALYQFRAALGLSVAPGLAIFAGPSLDILLTRTGEAPRAHTLSALEASTVSGSAHTYVWPGLVAGVRGL